jgi:hypothetical protein
MVVVVKELNVNVNVKISQTNKNLSSIPFHSVHSIPFIHSGEEKRGENAGFVVSIESSSVFFSFFFGGWPSLFPPLLPSSSSSSFSFSWRDSGMILLSDSLVAFLCLCFGGERGREGGRGSRYDIFLPVRQEKRPERGDPHIRTRGGRRRGAAGTEEEGEEGEKNIKKEGFH